MNLRKVQEALEALGVWDAISTAASRGSSLVSGGVSFFSSLLDVPDSYIGHGGKSVQVKVDETGLEYVTPAEGVTDHGDLDGLADDDHPQYHNDARGDARYVNVDGDDMTDDLTGTDFVRTRSGTITRDGDGLISQVALTGGRTLVITRDVNDRIESISDGTFVWDFTRTDDRITSWTVT